jgi:hypothetical protein
MKTRALKFFAALCLSMLVAVQPANAQQGSSKRPLFLYIFVHDDIGLKDRSALHKDYFEWMQKDLESFTGRRVSLQFIENTAPWTDFRYQGENVEKTHFEWARLVTQYRTDNNLPVNAVSKYILLTRNTLNEHTLGVTKAKHYAAIASAANYTTPAHEIGHMLGGTHEAAEVLFKKGWWCETNIVATRNPTLANCYIYSDKNKQIIAANLSEWP